MQMVCKAMPKQSIDDAGDLKCSIPHRRLPIYVVSSGPSSRNSMQSTEHARCVTSVVTVLCRSENSNLMFAGSAEAAGEGDKG